MAGEFLSAPVAVWVLCPDPRELVSWVREIAKPTAHSHNAPPDPI